MRLWSFSFHAKGFSGIGIYRAMCLTAGLLLCLYGVAKGSESTGGLEQYRLGAGDVVKILVFGEKDLSIETRVGDTGTISYPFLGELRISGLTPIELELLVTDGLKGPYLVDPKVTVSITEYRQIYVNGEVGAPGGYRFEPGLTVRKAVSIAGGFGERASKSKIFVIHEGDANAKPARVTLDDPVRPGDIITVEQSFF